jgi:DNA invertase Pin-like site-specific DNA recombinase
MTQDNSKYVAYLRVSTQRQGKSGLGLEAQRESVRQLVASRNGKIIASEFVEVESGKINDRPELQKALKRCRTTGATLVVARLDRLSRNAAFLMTLRDSGVQFIAADMPEANTMTVGVLAVVAQHVRETISANTKAALAAAKARGVKLGGHRPGGGQIHRWQREGTQAAARTAQERLLDVAEDLRTLKAEGLSLNAIARRLNEQDIQTARSSSWTATTVMRALARLS